jgi:hypothetical protein
LQVLQIALVGASASTDSAGRKLLKSSESLSAAVIVLSLPSQAESSTEWIDLGARAHRAFGPFILMASASA